MGTMENHAPIVFLQVPGAEPETQIPSAAAIVLGLVLAVLVAKALRMARGLRHEAGLMQGSAPTGAAPPAAARSGRPAAAAAPAVVPSGGAGRDACTWRFDRRRHGVALQRWTCTSCGVEAFTQDERPPKDCKRALRPTAL
jgi:hypothetical protein